MTAARTSSSLLPAAQRDLLRILGYSYQCNGRAEDAAIIFEALHALEPLDAFAARSLACAHVRQGKADKALEVLDGLQERGDASAIVHLLRGQALEALGRRAEAARAMRFYVATRAQDNRGEES